MDDKETLAVLHAIAQPSSDTVLTLFGEWVRAGKLRSVAEGFQMFRQAHSTNAAYVRARIPAKILNSVFLYGDVVDVNIVTSWSASEKRRDWADQIKDTLDNPVLFETLVQTMRNELVSLQQTNGARVLRYDVREVTEGSLIRYEAIESATGDVVPLNTPTDTGSYPDIEAHVHARHGNVGKIVYAPAAGDTFDQPNQTWTYKRKGFIIVVKDMVRTVIRVSSTS
jgi:hypothetical protein